MFRFLPDYQWFLFLPIIVSWLDVNKSTLTRESWSASIPTRKIDISTHHPYYFITIILAFFQNWFIWIRVTVNQDYNNEWIVYKLWRAASTYLPWRPSTGCAYGLSHSLIFLTVWFVTRACRQGLLAHTSNNSSSSSSFPCKVWTHNIQSAGSDQSLYGSDSQHVW